ncbi:hypothetical protein F1654_05365 [Alkalicaulis satelles]|uniref:Uncharacterized protein n=1 Tax=Alkalicaulis satelles TaxID=2609175 RepID=A0A5M6ZQ79_9PROT|nr:hypothetical protein [Alkalicaulis satelles]KAA5805408.1 hypothetical protein F1654_05365 [Alkalicaulis satelles]
MRACFIKVLALSFALAAPAAMAAAHDDRERREETLRDVIGQAHAAADRMASLRPAVEDDAFDILPAVERLDFDGHEIASFVTAQVRYEPYDGILRGAQATLSAKAGNAIDQSLLLITLLDMAGYDAQILRTDETGGELGRLLAHEATRERGPARAIADTQRLEDALIAVMGSRADRAAARSAANALGPGEAGALDEAVTQTAERLSDLITQPGARISSGDYFWVRYRLGPGMSWTEAHPALSGEAPEGLEPQEVITGTAPDDWLHYVEISLSAEILENGRLGQHSLMTPWRQPVAALFDRPVSLSMFGDISALSENQAGTLFMPTLNGDTPPGAHAVTLRGAIIDAGILQMDSSGMAGVFSTLGDLLQDSSDLASRGPEDQPTRALTGIILTVSWTQPSGETRTEERWLIDRLANRHASGEAPRLDLSKSLRWLAHRMNFRRDLLISAGGAHSAHRLAAALEAETARLRYGAHLLELTDAATGELRMNEAQPFSETHLPFLMNLQTVIDQDIRNPAGRHVYRDGPLVLSLHRAWDEQDDQNVAYIDILMNPWAGAALDGDSLVSWPAGALARGVLDTQAELDFGLGEPGSDYFGALERSRDLTIARRSSDVAHWPQDARLAAEADLAEGFALVMLQAETAQGVPLWWRVRADGGEVLGRNALGGQSTTEYIVAYASGAWALFSFSRDTKACMDGYDADQGLGCCLLYTVVYHSASAGIGAGAQAGLRAGAAHTAGSINQVTHVGALDLVSFLSVEAGFNMGGRFANEVLPSLTREGRCGPPTRNQ